MNRLKFRIWDKIGKVFRGNLYKYLINAETGELEVWSFSDLYDEWYNMCEDAEHLVVQQYTGLQDRDGKDIYEGDIVEYTYNVGCFRFSNGKLIRGCIPSNEIIQEKINQQVKWQGAQVIGNIFENPELIKTNE